MSHNYHKISLILAISLIMLAVLSARSTQIFGTARRSDYLSKKHKRQKQRKGFPFCSDIGGGLILVIPAIHHPIATHHIGVSSAHLFTRAKSHADR